MLTKRLILCALVTLLTVTHLRADGHLTRDAAIARGMADNPELKVAAIEIDRYKSRFKWAGRIDNPELELSGSDDSIGLNEGEAGFEIAFSQRFPVTSRLAKEKIVRKQDVELAQIEYQIRQRQLAYEIDKAWLELRATKRTVAITSKMLTVNKEISTFMEQGAKTGELSPLDGVQAALNGKLLEQQIGLAKANVDATAARLKQFIGAQPDTSLTIAEGSSLPNSAPATSIDLNTALTNRPDYTALAASSNVSTAQLSLAMAQRWDDIAVKVFLQSDNAVDQPDGLERNTLAGVGISIPLPIRNKNEVAIEDAQLDIEKAKRARSAKAFAIDSEIRAALKARRSAYDLAISAKTEALPLAQKNLSEFQKAQQNGQASLLQVQQAQSQLLQLETAELELTKNYELLDAEVRFISGKYP